MSKAKNPEAEDTAGREAELIDLLNKNEAERKELHAELNAIVEKRYAAEQEARAKGAADRNKSNAAVSALLRNDMASRMAALFVKDPTAVKPKKDAE